MNKDIGLLSLKFKEEGFLSPVTVFTMEEIQKYQSCFLEFEDHLSEKREDYENLHFHATWAMDLATHPKLVELIESIIGPEILIYGTLVLSKIPGKNTHLSWHQDQYFMPRDEKSPYITAWIALTDSTVQNGCMKVIPGSHKQGIIPHLPFERDDTNMLTRGEEIKIMPNKNEVFNVTLKPTQLSLHDGAMVHSSFHNLTNKNRVGFIVRYITPEILHTRNPLVRLKGKKDISNLLIYEKSPHEGVKAAVVSYQNFRKNK